ncbi:hypothetical protein SERLA73DRAFT_145086 [Serpula lacrymans var. lacrymans S7.3]|uniref:Uncharacterized protein n=1 Tax=Serpula lacrymans var. lacrymans (strain S7.3) TaxID=936435 RepID=F8QCZ9_SERL3|nr:hypothetical protein SERLA73DRAFT_145086 [Serpula lacrymans var. lacrymans S7.3]
MTSIPDGTFQIFSADLKVGHLDISLIAPSIFPPYFFVIGSHRKDLNEQVSQRSHERSRIL